MTVSVADMNRLAGEIVAGACAPEDWCEREGIDIDAMAALFESATRNFAIKIIEDGDASGAIYDIVGQAFRLGWEAYQQYGGKG